MDAGSLMYIEKLPIKQWQMKVYSLRGSLTKNTLHIYIYNHIVGDCYWVEEHSIINIIYIYVIFRFFSLWVILNVMFDINHF